MSDDFDALPGDVRAILRAERARVTVPDDARARLAERLAMGVPGFGPAHVPATTVAPPAGALGAAAAKVLVVLALGSGAAATIRSALSHGHATAPARAQATAVIARELAPHAARVVNGQPDVTRSPAPPPPRVAPPVTPAPVMLTATASLREERRLLDEARDAIIRGEPEAALAPTASHDARFPHGVLAEERDALRIRALARLGRGEEARALLATLRTLHPRSFLLEGAAADVEAIP